LTKAETVELDVMELTSLDYDYSATPEVMKLIKEFDIAILHRDFTEGCHVDLQVKLRMAKALQEKLDLLRALGVKVSVNSRKK
jgi:putative IMPACT (imprinted ancient) family translation regulator